MRPIRRRMLLAAAALAAAPLHARAQPSSRIRRIGFLSDLPAAHERARWTEAALTEALRASGYEIGRNLLVEWRWGDGDPAGLPALAEDLVRREVELIVAWSNADTAAAMRASGTIPIVMLFAYAPVETGLVASLSHPGGSITGTVWLSPETVAKTLQILKEAKPSAKRIASLAHPSSRPAAFTAAFDLAARLLGLEIDRVEVTGPERLPEALERVAAGRPEALYVAVNPTLQARMREIGDFARERRLVSLGTSQSYVLDGGGLLSYSPVPVELVARAATYVERILGGENPARLPIALPQKYALLIHAGTARAMGYAVPASLLLRADRVIE